MSKLSLAEGVSRVGNHREREKKHSWCEQMCFLKIESNLNVNDSRLGGQGPLQ